MQRDFHYISPRRSLEVTEVGKGPLREQRVSRKEEGPRGQGLRAQTLAGQQGRIRAAGASGEGALGAQTK